MTNPEKTWRKSSYTAPDNNCVELAVGEAETEVRDSKDPDSASVAVGANSWLSFLAFTKADGLKY
ncbi:DUF397 domain-containing protein [Lentzea sp. NPDC058450]|uniref:DUF397 domain-containing protein n=1 Tax=Lentzea sp. NPDC058450 TaxID=3346505 RepID=UPI0036638CA7